MYSKKVNPLRFNNPTKRDSASSVMTNVDGADRRK
jgi:hypothetical protein